LLTSRDPEYKTKIGAIKKILSELESDEGLLFDRRIRPVCGEEERRAEVGRPRGDLHGASMAEVEGLL
jgi:hypothetical protein